MMMWKALNNGWIPPDFCSEELYQEIRNCSPSALRGLIGFGQSFGGKWFGGYARGKTSNGIDRNYLAETNRNNAKIAKKFDQIICADYRALEVPENCTVYCDPPYKGTQDYGSTFDTREFWKIMRKWRLKGANIFISEYDAPLDFECVAEFDHRLSLTLPEQGREARKERLWR